MTPEQKKEVYDRLRFLELEELRGDEHYKTLQRDLNDFKENFKHHDIEEMKKYDKIQESLRILIRDRNYVVGFFIIYQILSKLGYI